MPYGLTHRHHGCLYLVILTTLLSHLMSIGLYPLF
ncbi:hypothetical protein VPHK453_0030 [Vibrio phage K453]